MSIPDDAIASHARRARGENVGCRRSTQRAREVDGDLRDRGGAEREQHRGDGLVVVA